MWVLCLKNGEEASKVEQYDGGRPSSQGGQRRGGGQTLGGLEDRGSGLYSKWSGETLAHSAFEQTGTQEKYFKVTDAILFLKAAAGKSYFVSLKTIHSRYYQLPATTAMQGPQVVGRATSAPTDSERKEFCGQNSRVS